MANLIGTFILYWVKNKKYDKQKQKEKTAIAVGREQPDQRITVPDIQVLFGRNYRQNKLHLGEHGLCEV